MNQLIAKPILWIMIFLRNSSLRKPTIKLLAVIHNASYRGIAGLASKNGIHPKHAIQNYYEFFLEHISKNDNVIDIGSGKGATAYRVSEKAAKVLGIDISKESTIHANKTYKRSNLSFIRGDATTYHFNETYDVIILSNVLEHIKDRVEFLKKISTLAPKILIRVPMITRDWISVYKKNEGLEYRLDYTHEIEYDNETFEKEMKSAGLTIESTHVEYGEMYAVILTKTKQSI